MSQRLFRAALACILACFTGASAMAAETAPRGWITTPDGPKHVRSGVTCPENFADHPFQKVTLDGDAAMLGRCHYPANGMDAWLRIREYHRGSGESQMAVDIDNTLMNPKPEEDWIASGYRFTPGTASDGRSYIDLVVTTRVNDLLVDCIARRYSGEQGGEEFVAFCSGSLQPFDRSKK